MHVRKTLQQLTPEDFTCSWNYDVPKKKIIKQQTNKKLLYSCGEHYYTQ